MNWDTSMGFIFEKSILISSSTVSIYFKSAVVAEIVNLFLQLFQIYSYCSCIYQIIFKFLFILLKYKWISQMIKIPKISEMKRVIRRSQLDLEVVLTLKSRFENNRIVFITH
jgi:hypothetical protein